MMHNGTRVYTLEGGSFVPHLCRFLASILLHIDKQRVAANFGLLPRMTSRDICCSAIRFFFAYL